ncbi:MAG TPA: ABC transporter substrate-binding protein [Bradyrhizobium sp.]|jgi:NitT/TauT family transport system substrate-binding protein|nr:ABC transporter substrate-binding protein [Bradyrhizobium sp.]
MEIVSRALAAWLVLTANLLPMMASAAFAEANEIRVSRGYSVLYLPQMVMQKGGLIEKHARALGLGEVKVTWKVLDGGNVINDALLSGTLDVAAVGTPGFLILWSKALGNPSAEVAGLSGISSTPMYLNTTNPKIKTLADFGPGDKIAVAGVKSSLPAGILQMMVAHEFGPANYAQLDKFTVAVPYPDATAAMLSGKTEINAHVASPPFSFMELDNPNIRRIANSADVLGDMTLVMSASPKRFHDANPVLCKAYVEALDEANRLIAADPQSAAGIYNEASATKVPNPMMLRILSDKDTHFSTTPSGIARWASFMKSIGLIRQDVTDWKQFFYPESHGLAGS